MRDEKLKYGYNGVAATALGIVQLMLGTGSVIVGIICIFQLTSFGFIAHGVWCGTIFIVAGALVTAAGSRPKDSVVIAGTVLSVLAMLLALAQMGLAAIGLYYDISQAYCASSSPCGTEPFIYCSRWSTGIQCLEIKGHNASVILGIVLAVLGLVEFAFALASACLVCTCCSVKDNKVKQSPDSRSTSTTIQPTFVPAPPSNGRISNNYDLDDIKSYRSSSIRRGPPQEWRASYAN